MHKYPLTTPSHEDVDTEAVALLAEAPVLRAKLGDADVWLAAGHDQVRQVLSDQRFSREAAMGPNAPVTLRSAYDPDILTSQDPPRHGRTRKLLARAFSPRIVALLEPRIQDIVDDLLTGIAADGPPVDLVERYFGPLPIMVICELLGVPYAERDSIRGWARQLMSNVATAEETAEAVKQVRAYLGKLVEAKRAQPAEDLTSALVEVTGSGEALSEIELVANLQLLLIAGHETTVNQLGNSVLTLLRHPDQLALLRQQPGLMGQAVEELLRYARLTPIMLPRVAVEDVPLGGELVKAGEGVFALTGGGNQDPMVFAEPERFDITRPNANQHVTFGHGTHYCLGAPLARLELTTALSALLTRFPDLALAVDESELTWRPGTPIRALEKLPVTW